jgi:hypothetical protein
MPRIQSLGANIISAERSRQINVEGFSLESDLKLYKQNNQLLEAAQWYLAAALRSLPDAEWPWDPKDYKVSETEVGNLIKAGALIAAHIDVVLSNPLVHK